MIKHRYQDLIEIFHRSFYQQYQTRLVKGDDEPVYLVGDSNSAEQEKRDHQIVFAHGYYASGLHEISHWLVAGRERRKLEDFGYWYQPDGRTTAEQAVFEQVEVKPQAMEWLLCAAAGFDFNVSCDNLSGEATDRVAFQGKVHQRVLDLLHRGAGRRAEQLIGALTDFYQNPLPLTPEQFTFDGQLNLVKEPCHA
ncbi:MAG: elongation factor P hydroxylase [Phenylobacterium sp.]|jgi:elongation factor P hydroxylase